MSQICSLSVPGPMTTGDDSDLESEHDDGQTTSQSVTDHIKTAKDMINASRKRREAKRKAIELEYTRAIEQVKAVSVSHYENRLSKMIDAQAAQWLQLSTLLKSKKNIERQILEHVKSIDKMTRNFSQEFIAILDGRLEELGEPRKKTLPKADIGKEMSYHNAVFHDDMNVETQERTRTKRFDDKVINAKKDRR